MTMLQYVDILTEYNQFSEKLSSHQHYGDCVNLPEHSKSADGMASHAVIRLIPNRMYLNWDFFINKQYLHVLMMTHFMFYLFFLLFQQINDDGDDDNMLMKTDGLSSKRRQTRTATSLS